MVGNSAAILNGVPVLTQDIDFYVRPTTLNRRKIAAAARNLGPYVSVLTNPPLSEITRLAGWVAPVDFIVTVGGGKSFESIRSRASKYPGVDGRIWVASLADVIAMKKAANRPKDRAVMGILEQTLKLKQATGGTVAERRVHWKRPPTRRRR